MKRRAMKDRKRGRWQSVSQSVQLLEARFQQSRKRGLRPEVGTDLWDTHATRRITHSLAHNILPSPYFPLAKPSTPLLPSIPLRSIASNWDKRQTRTNTANQYLLRIGIMLSRGSHLMHTPLKFINKIS